MCRNLSSRQYDSHFAPVYFFNDAESNWNAGRDLFFVQLKVLTTEINAGAWKNSTWDEEGEEAL